MAAISTLVDRVKIVVLSSGTGPFALGQAVPAFRGVEALIDGATYSYATDNGSLFEVGTAIYLASSNTLVRSPLISSNNGAAVAFPANIEVAFTALAQDILPPGALPIVQSTGTSTIVAMSQKAVTDALNALSDAVTTAATAAANALSTATDAGNLAATKAKATALGVAATADNLGTFTGTTIPDNQSAKQALQALETAHETQVPITQNVDNVRTLTKQLISNAGPNNFTSPLAVTTTSGSPNLTGVGGGAYAGQMISGTGIPGGAYLVSVSGSTAVLSANATASGSITAAVSAPHIADIQHQQTVPLDYATQNVNRNSGITGGLNGSLNTTIRALNNVYNSAAYNATTNPLGKGVPGGYDGLSYENGITSLLFNGRIYQDPVSGYVGQNCAAVFFGLKQNAASGATWGANIGVKEFTGSLGTQLSVALETDVHADGYDTNNVRLGVTAVMKSLSTVDGAPSGFGEGYTGMWVAADEGANGYNTGSWFSRWKRGFVASGPMDVAFDASQTTNDAATTPFITPIAFRMSRSSQISFDIADARRLGVDGATNLLRYLTGSATAFLMDDSGNASFGNSGPIVATNTQALQVYRASGDSLLVAKAGTIDTRVASAGSIGAAIIGTYSNHVALLFQNGNEQARLVSTGINMNGILGLKSYTLATVPSALTGGIIYISNLTGGAEPCFSDGTNWRRCSDRSIAS